MFKLLKPKNVRTLGRLLSNRRPPEDAGRRIARILKQDMKLTKDWLTGNYKHPYEFPTHCDVLIIGGGATGLSAAYWLKKKTEGKLEVVVIEKDIEYKRASTTMSVGGLKQQFSLAENIEMSLFGAEFLRNAKQNLGENIDVQYTPNGYLTLASERGVETLIRNVELQRKLGAKIELLSTDQLNHRYPWLNTSDIVLASQGLENEGWFDQWALLCGLQQANFQMGVKIIHGKVTDFLLETIDGYQTDLSPMSKHQGVNKVDVEIREGALVGETITVQFATCVLSAGYNSGKMAEKALIGRGDGILRLPLPIEARKRYVYCFECQNGPTLNTPLTLDPSGTYFRKEGQAGLYLCGRPPERHTDEPTLDNMDVDYEYFDEKIRPILEARVPQFRELEMRNAWAGLSEYNWFDQNGVLGAHPYFMNMFIAAGFSGNNGIQHAPAVGRGVAELIIDSQFKTIDLSRLSFDRLVMDKPMLETVIV